MGRVGLPRFRAQLGLLDLRCALSPCRRLFSEFPQKHPGIPYASLRSFLVVRLKWAQLSRRLGPGTVRRNGFSMGDPLHSRQTCGVLETVRQALCRCTAAPRNQDLFLAAGKLLADIESHLSRANQEVLEIVLMTKWLVLPLLPGLLGITAGVTAKVAGPAARTQTFFALEREWNAHWPFEIGKSLPSRWERHFEPFVPVWRQVDPHVTMLLDPYDLVPRVILQTGSWEPDSWRAVADHLHTGDTFVDIGAHIGYYSLKAAPVVGPGGRVIAVEPNPETVRRLRDNIRASVAASVVSVQPVACSDVEATLDLFAASRNNTGETSLSHTNASQAGLSVASYRVRSRPLDDIVKESGVARVDAVKIDVEGAEYLVLKGAHETLKRYHPVIIVESHRAPVAGHGYQHRGGRGAAQLPRLRVAPFVRRKRRVRCDRRLLKSGVTWPANAATTTVMSSSDGAVPPVNAATPHPPDSGPPLRAPVPALRFRRLSAVITRDPAPAAAPPVPIVSSSAAGRRRIPPAFHPRRSHDGTESRLE